MKCFLVLILLKTKILASLEHPLTSSPSMEEITLRRLFFTYTAQKEFSGQYFFTFTKEIDNGKLYFLCSAMF